MVNNTKQDNNFYDNNNHESNLTVAASNGKNAPSYYI